jgi:hypothetical protein
LAASQYLTPVAATYKRPASLPAAAPGLPQYAFPAREDSYIIPLVGDEVWLPEHRTRGRITSLCRICRQGDDYALWYEVEGKNGTYETPLFALEIMTGQARRVRVNEVADVLEESLTGRYAELVERVRWGSWYEGARAEDLTKGLVGIAQAAQTGELRISGPRSRAPVVTMPRQYVA